MNRTEGGFPIHKNRAEGPCPLLLAAGIKGVGQKGNSGMKIIDKIRRAVDHRHGVGRAAFVPASHYDKIQLIILYSHKTARSRAVGARVGGRQGRAGRHNRGLLDLQLRTFQCADFARPFCDAVAAGKIGL